MADLAKTYEQIDVLDSALNWAQKSMQLEIKTDGKQSSSNSGNILGNIYSKLGQPALAMDYFRSFLNGIGDNPSKTKDKALCFYEIAKHFERNKQHDSAVLYARKAYELSLQHSFKINILNTSILLSKLYQSSNQTDSAYKYLKIKDETQENMFSKEKLSRMHTLEFNEQVSQRESENARQDEAQQRSRNIQLIILAISIITAIILFLLLSRSILVSHKLVGFLSIVALLVVFEFINLLVHPFFEKLTHHSPVLMLFALVSIAAILVPTHHRIEKWATSKLVEKNKNIRLQAARNTIEELEGKTGNSTQSDQSSQ